MKQLNYEMMSSVKGGIEPTTISMIAVGIAAFAAVIGLSTTISSWLAPARAQGKCC